MTKKDFKRGQTVFLVIREHSNAERRIADKNKVDSYIIRGEVKSVGTRYITVFAGCETVKFDIDSFIEVTDYGGANYTLHLTRKEAYDKRLGLCLFRKCHDAFSFQNQKYTVDQLRRILEIIAPEEIASFAEYFQDD